MLLDSELSINIISNHAMVTNIRKAPNTVILHYNTGSQQVEYTVELNGYGRVWYEPKAISNILSPFCSTRKYQVVFDIKDGNCFRLMLPGREVVFNIITNRM